jgi:hypothetical protein
MVLKKERKYPPYHKQGEVNKMCHYRTNSCSSGLSNMRTNLWLSVLLVLVLLLNVTTALPLLSPAVFVSRYSPPAHAKTQLPARKTQIRPVSGIENR